MQLVATCAACHRLDNRPNGIPPIVGLGSRQLVNMMNAFKARPQSNPIMHAVSQPLSAQEVTEIAAYLGRLDQERDP